MKKLSIVTIGILTLLVVISTTVLAANSAKINISVPKEIKKGETIQAKLVIENASDGVSGIQGKLEYDASVLEYIDSKALLEGWFISGFNKDTGIFLIEPTNVGDTDKFITGTKNVIEISFKVKEDSNEEETEIKISNIVLSGANSENKEISKTIKITNENDNSDNNNNDNNNTNINNNNNDDNNNSGNSDNNNEDNNNNSGNSNNNNEDNNNNSGNSNNNNNNNTNINNNNNDDNNNSGNSDNNNSGNSNNNNSNNNNNTDKSTIKENKLPKTGTNENLLIMTLILFAIVIFAYKKYRKYKDI